MGDSLLCTAYAGEDAGEAQFGLSFDGGEIHAGPAAAPFPLTFPKPGTFTLAAETAGGRRDVQVVVVAASFGPDLNVAVGRARTWPLPQVAPDLALECDPGIIIEDTGAQSASPGRCLSVSVRGEGSGDFNILARLGAGGPIVASSTVHGFLLAPATVTGDSRVVQTLPDGTVVIRVGYVIDGRVPADLSVWLQIFVTNAVFANGDTWYHLTAADFDANGQASLLIYKAPVDGQANMPHYICHRVNAYADAPPGAQVQVAPDAAAPPASSVPPADATPKAP